MKISALRLFNVKRFAGRGVAIEGISDGVNVLCAANEFGKSTSFEALHALFFQQHSGTPKEVQRLRPYSGGNPLVEADISTSAGQFRLSKQYYGGRRASITDIATGRLIAQADEAENFIADLVRGGTAGPAGLLWVRQGITGIARRSNSEEEGEKQARASLLESVQGEVEAVTGGRRMAEIMGACETALDALVTATGRPKTGGRYFAALEEQGRLADAERRLAEEVAALREALEERSAAARRLEELERPEEREARRSAVEQAETAYEASRAQGDALKAAEAETRLALERKNAASRELTAFREALSKAARLVTEMEAADTRRKETAARRIAALEATAKAKADLENAEDEEQQARSLLQRLDAALSARSMVERLAELKQRLTDAETTRLASEKAEAALALLRLPARAIDELQEIEVEIVRLRAVENAARPTVAIAYEEKNAFKVGLNGTPLIDGEERSYDGQATLTIPGIATISLRSNRTVENDGRLAQMEDERRKMLAAMGVDDLAAARARQIEAERKERELAELRSRMSVLAPDGLPALRKQVAHDDASKAECLELKEDPAQIRAAHEASEKRRAHARAALKEVDTLWSGTDEAIITAETEMASLTAERTQVEAVLGPEETRAERERVMQEHLDCCETAFVENEQRLVELRGRMVDLESVEAALKRARSVEEAANKEAATLRETIAGLNGSIRRDSDSAIEEDWHETADTLHTAIKRVDAFKREVAVLERLRSALEAARSAASDLYLKPVLAELRPLLGILFDDVSVTFDEKTLLPQTIMRNGQEEDVERLSGGMREQLSILTRLAFARLLARDGKPAPVILDDALVYSDDDRIEKMFDALHRQARDQQIIVFSCRQRAFSKLGGNVLRMIDWQPDDQ